MPEAVVKLVGITKHFGEVVAVDRVTLAIEQGEFFSLLGPSGCGKTTTLRIIGGFEEPDEGTVELAGKDVAGLPPYRRNVNTVFQSYALFPHLTVFENVAYGLKRRRVERAEISARVADILELVDLPRFEQRGPSQLSGGQQQRVALARALVNHPQVLLLDEPLGALDFKLRKQMQLELKRIQQEVGITFIYVTHDQEEAMTMSDRIAVMRAGRIEQLDRPQDLYEHPATEFVAGFLGASNLLSGTVEERDATLATVALTSGERVRMPTERLDGLGPSVKVGVRPEKARIVAADRPPETGENAVAGTLRVTTFVGVSNVHTIDTPSGDTLTVYAQNIGARERPPAPGERVLLVWRPEHTFVVRSAEEGGIDG